MRSALVAALLLVSTAAVAQEGQRGSGHSNMHDFYQNLYNNKKDVACCHDQDCRPTQSRMINDHYEVKINGVWMTVDKDSIIPVSAPDGGAHICAGEPTTMNPVGRVYCVMLPPEG